MIRLNYVTALFVLCLWPDQRQGRAHPPRILISSIRSLTEQLILSLALLRDEPTDTYRRNFTPKPENLCPILEELCPEGQMV